MECLCHYVNNVNDEYAICGCLVRWATTGYEGVTCPVCKSRLTRAQPDAAGGEQAEQLTLNAAPEI